MTTRNIVKIDQELCDGCGLCVPSCAEGAIQIIDGKAQLVRDDFCDGLGVCLGECPNGALAIEQREAVDFDARAVGEHLNGVSQHQREIRKPVKKSLALGNTTDRGFKSCPSARLLDLREESRPAVDVDVQSAMRESSLSHWPVKLKLVPPTASFLQSSDLLLVADCAPFALANFHGELLADHAVVIGCPKFDDYLEDRDRLTQILQRSGVRSLTVVTMEVPCCFGFWKMANEAVNASGHNIPLRQITIGIRGEILPTKERQAVGL